MQYTGIKWGKAFEWEIKGAGVEKVWAVTGNFVEADKWATSLVKSCELVEGEPQMVGCVRKVVTFPMAPGEPTSYALEKLLDMDQLQHRYTYALLECTLPGVSYLKDYISTFKLSPRPCDEGSTLLRWSFACSPVSTLTEEQAHRIIFSLYDAAVNELIKRLSLPGDSISVLL